LTACAVQNSCASEREAIRKKPGDPALRGGNASQISFVVPYTGDVDSDYLVFVGGVLVYASVSSMTTMSEG